MYIITLLCDLDGTLIDSRRDIALAFQHALGEVVGGTLPEEAAIAQHIGKPLAQMTYALGYRLPEAQLEAFLRTYRARYAATCTRHTRPYPGVLATLRSLPAVTFGVVTTKAQEQAESVLHQLDMVPLFRHIQGSVPTLRTKPAPDTVLAALAALQSAPEQAMMVGDTPADILAGRAAGVRTCAVTYGIGAREELQDCRPDYIIDAFESLLTLL